MNPRRIYAALRAAHPLEAESTLWIAAWGRKGEYQDHTSGWSRLDPEALEAMQTTLVDVWDQGMLPNGCWSSRGVLLPGDYGI